LSQDAYNMNSYFRCKRIFILTTLIFCIVFTANNFVFAQDCGPDSICPAIKGSVTDIIGNLIDFLLTIALIICPLMIVIGGFFFITAAGDPAKANKGRQIMLYALIGLVIILISKGLVAAVQKAVGAA